MKFTDSLNRPNLKILNILIALNNLTKKPSLIPIKNNGISAIASIRAGNVKIYLNLPLKPLNLSI